MVIEYGYITLFASAFPLASALSIVCNLIEIRSDGFKLAFVTRKPTARRVHSIGTWEKVVAALGNRTQVRRFSYFKVG